VNAGRNDFDSVLKAMFRTRGESQRIDIADALGRHYYHDHKLGTKFEMAIGAMRHCLRIRNQYAHSVWWDDQSGKLSFANLEEIAKQHTHLIDLSSLTTFYVDVPRCSMPKRLISSTWTSFCYGLITRVESGPVKHPELGSDSPGNAHVH
jgi:hypothetical protein